MVTINDFKNFEIRVATIKEVLDHPSADKLYILKVDLGDNLKQLVAGIKSSYTKEDLVGKQIVMIDNLEPAIIRGMESQGMLLAASDESGIAIVSPARFIKEGSKVK